jgi:hypothetical protein
LSCAIDLLYLTRFDADEDRTAYTEISAGKRRSQYVFVKKRGPDIFNHLLSHAKAPNWVWKNQYETVWLSSIETPTVAAIANRQKGAKLYTFDDGIGNCLTSAPMGQI